MTGMKCILLIRAVSPFESQEKIMVYGTKKKSNYNAGSPWRTNGNIRYQSYSHHMAYQLPASLQVAGPY